MVTRRASDSLKSVERLLTILIESPALSSADRTLFEDEREKVFCQFVDELQALTERVGSALQAPATAPNVSETLTSRTYLTATTGTVPGAIRLILAKSPEGLTTYQITRAVQELRPDTAEGRVPTALTQMMSRKELEREGSFKNYIYRLRRVAAPDDSANSSGRVPDDFAKSSASNGLRLKGSAIE